MSAHCSCSHQGPRPPHPHCREEAARAGQGRAAGAQRPVNKLLPSSRPSSRALPRRKIQLVSSNCFAEDPEKRGQRKGPAWRLLCGGGRAGATADGGRLLSCRPLCVLNVALPRGLCGPGPQAHLFPAETGSSESSTGPFQPSPSQPQLWRSWGGGVPGQSPQVASVCRQGAVWPSAPQTGHPCPGLYAGLSSSPQTLCLLAPGPLHRPPLPCLASFLFKSLAPTTTGLLSTLLSPWASSKWTAGSPRGRCPV